MVTNVVEDTLVENIRDAMDRGIKIGTRLGATEVEAFGIMSKNLTFNLEKEVSKHSLGIIHGISFRVILDRKMGFAYSSSLDEDSIKKTLELAINVAKMSEPEPDLQSFPGDMPTKDNLPLDKHLYTLDVEQASDLFQELSDVDKSLLPKDLYFLAAQAMFFSSDILIQNTSGLNVHDKLAAYGMGIGFLSIKGFPSYDFHFDSSRRWNELDPNEIRKKGIEKALASSSPKTLSLSAKLPVILTPQALDGIFGGLFEVLKRLLEGNKAWRGDSVFANKIGEKVADESFTMIDDPLHPRLITSSLHDGEGYPTRKTTLIENGILKEYYLDSLHAKKLEMENNAKTSRGSIVMGNPIKYPPTIAHFGTLVKPGNSTLDEMISETREGFMLNSLMGVHMSDFSSGRFSVTGSGWYIKNGTVKYSVQDVTISGTIPDLLMNIDTISKETENVSHGILPFIKFSNVNVAARKLDFKTRLGYKILKLLIALRLVKNPFV